MRRKTILFGAGILVVTIFLMHARCVKEPAGIEPPSHLEPDSAVALNASNFDSLALDSGVVAVVEFYSAGCQVCAGMAWVIDSLATVWKDSVLVGAVNTDNDDTLWKRFAVNTVPTYLFFHDSMLITQRSYASVTPAAYDTLAFILREMLAGRLSLDTSDTVRPADTIPDGPVVLKPDNFAALTAVAGRVSMVEFFSPLCGACQLMESTVDSLAAMFKGRALISKVNVNEQDSLRQAFAVNSWPTFIFFAGGVEQSRRIGSMPFDSLAAVIEGMLNSGN